MAHPNTVVCRRAREKSDVPNAGIIHLRRQLPKDRAAETLWEGFACILGVTPSRASQ